MSVGDSGSTLYVGYFAAEEDFAGLWGALRGTQEDRKMNKALLRQEKRGIQ